MRKPVFTPRVLGVLAAAALLSVTLADGAEAQMTPELKPTVEVTGDYVLLGDLFTNAGTVAEIAVFKAPAPGGSGTVNTERLARVARSHGLEWVNPRGIPQVQVSRAGLLISDDEIRDAIGDTLAERIASPVAGRGFDVRFNGDPEPFHVASDRAPTVEIIQLRYNRRSGHFTAVVAAPAGDPAARRRSYSGRAVEVTTIAVPVHTMPRGAVITEHDVEMRDVALRRTDATTLTEMSDLIGMAARRTLRAGEPLRPRDLERPQVVRKNRQVTVQYKSAGLHLTVRATALQSGALGDIIEIRNSKSKRIIQGRVIGPERVEAIVGEPRTLAQAN